MDRLIALAPPCQSRVHNAFVIPISRETLSAMPRARNPQRYEAVDIATACSLTALKERSFCSGELSRTKK